MKYVIVIPDGGADLPIDELDGRTPFEAAATPNLDALARAGRVGTCATTPPGFGAGSDVCTMSLLGYDPKQYHTGRAPLEAAALGIEPGDEAWISRVNLVTVGTDGDDDGMMLDHAGGAISDAEARTLLADLDKHWRREAPELMNAVSLHPGVSYRNIMVDASGRAYEGVATTPPHEIPNEPWREHLPAGEVEAAGALARLIELSGPFLAGHPINQSRAQRGERPANLAWIWGQGTRPSLPNFEQRFGLRGAMLTSVDLLRGIANLIGWDLIDCPGLTSYHDTDYAGQGAATIAALRDYDVVCCHVEAPDEASHQADHETKVASLEAIDRAIMGPLIAHLHEYGNPEVDPRAQGWRVLVMPDHYTLCETRKHDATPVPFAMGGAWVRSVVEHALTERDGAASDVHIDPGHELMEYFLFSGVKGPRPRGR
ncbi:MAG: cofactor-independent phosphoglycerate mutase [Phycisphaeraceae bacterium]|nr:MAG: cofactor-independent phosphoglycerate mutase [Phycisphaeraceae bacterium]